MTIAVGACPPPRREPARPCAGPIDPCFQSRGCGANGPGNGLSIIRVIRRSWVDFTRMAVPPPRRRRRSEGQAGPHRRGPGGTSRRRPVRRAAAWLQPAVSNALVRSRAEPTSPNAETRRSQVRD